MDSIPVVDIFAGPGGLGEGFSAFETGRRTRPFNIVVSAEKDPAAHRTLKLRAFFRAFGPLENVPQSYYEYLKAPTWRTPFDERSSREWKKACGEALNLTLGIKRDNEHLYAKIASGTSPHKPWILIGGPPCQAYSLVGRSRNKGKAEYRPEDDDRHFLYREYLEILASYRPHVFIMENVRGILTSSINGIRIFDQILSDLRNPSIALHKKNGPGYRILALDGNGETELTESSRYVIRSELHGIPQARHRVILLGVRDDMAGGIHPKIVPTDRVTVAEAWNGLPLLRSGLSRRGGIEDSAAAWLATVKTQRRETLKALVGNRHFAGTANVLRDIRFRDDLPRGEIFSPDLSKKRPRSQTFETWIRDARLRGILNHESRTHMPLDLGRYMFCAAYATANDGRSPRAPEFPAHLVPKHRSWRKNIFVDRFKVQPSAGQSGTITSHIAKDGHYFIHYDPAQCRSMTVREAARLQTFPDNYFFCGNRTQQFVQVGNAVPPLLARAIAEVVWKLISGR